MAIDNIEKKEKFYSYKDFKGKRVLADKRSLYVITNSSSPDEIDEFCKKLILEVERYVEKFKIPGPKLNHKYRKNVVLNLKNSQQKYLGWSILYFLDCRIYNLVTGLTIDGKDRNYDTSNDTPEWTAEAPIIKDEDHLLITIPKMHCSNLEIDFTPVIKPYYISDLKDYNFTKTSLVAINIPLGVTDSLIYEIFKTYSTSPSYPKIKMYNTKNRKRKKCIIKFQNLEDMLFARVMQMITYISFEDKIYAIKVQREYKN